MRSELFGSKLKEILTTLGISQIDLANKTGLTQASISHILTGKREPSLSSIIAILEVIPVKFEKLVGKE